MPVATARRLPAPTLLFLLLGGLVLAFLWAERSRASRGDMLYGALIMATNSAHPDPPPPEIRGQAENLKAVFGYNDFRLLGQKREPATARTGDWFVPSRQFFLRVDTKSPVSDGYLLGLELVRENHVLVQADAKLHRDQPLFIRGPFVGQGQLIIVLMVL